MSGCSEVVLNDVRVTHCWELAALLGCEFDALVPAEAGIQPKGLHCLCAVDVAESVRRNGMFAVKKANVYWLKPAA